MSTGLRAGTNNDGYLQVNGTDVLTALSSGRIGIGTTGPARKVEIVDTAATVLQLNSTSSDGTSLRILHSGNDKMYMGLAGDFIIGQANNVTDSAIRSNGSLLFASGGGTERLRVTDTGLVRVPDAGKFTVGNDDDLQIYYDSATGDSFIKETGSGNLKLVTSNFRLRNAADSEHIIWANQDAEVRLYHDSSLKFETTSTGAKVTGALEVTQEYPSIRPTLDLNFAATKTLDRRITFRRNSLGTYYGDDGLLKYAANNVPRFDHDPDTRESLGLLIEESSTNLISGSGGYGSDIRNGSNLGNAPTSSVVDGITLPDGTVGKVRRIQIHPSGNSGMRWGNTSGGNGNTPYSASVWARATSGTATAVIDVNDMGNNSYNLTEEWVRMTVTGTRADAYQFMDVMGSAGHDFYLWGFQIENKGFVSSYIPVASNESNKTRAQDTAKITGTNFTDFYNQSEGTLVAHYYSTVDDGYLAQLENSATPGDDRIGFVNYAGYQGFVETGNSTQANLDNGTPTVGGVNKVAFAFKTNDFAVSLNSASPSIDTSGTMPTVDRMMIGSRHGGAYDVLKSTLRHLSYYPKRLSNTQLQGLTQQ